MKSGMSAICSGNRQPHQDQGVDHAPPGEADAPEPVAGERRDGHGDDHRDRRDHDAVPVEAPDVAGHPGLGIVLRPEGPGHHPPREELGIVHERHAQHVEAGRDGERERREEDHAARPATPRPVLRARHARRIGRALTRAAPSTEEGRVLIARYAPRSRKRNVCSRAVPSTRATRMTAMAEATPISFSSKAWR